MSNLLWYLHHSYNCEQAVQHHLPETPLRMKQPQHPPRRGQLILWCSSCSQHHKPHHLDSLHQLPIPHFTTVHLKPVPIAFIQTLHHSHPQATILHNTKSYITHSENQIYTEQHSRTAPPTLTHTSDFLIMEQLLTPLQPQSFPTSQQSLTPQAQLAPSLHPTPNPTPNPTPAKQPFERIQAGPHGLQSSHTTCISGSVLLAAAQRAGRNGADGNMELRSVSRSAQDTRISELGSTQRNLYPTNK